MYFRVPDIYFDEMRKKMVHIILAAWRFYASSRSVIIERQQGKP
jgi:hypothetical protein